MLGGGGGEETWSYTFIGHIRVTLKNYFFPFEFRQIVLKFCSNFYNFQALFAKNSAFF